MASSSSHLYFKLEDNANVEAAIVQAIIAISNITGGKFAYGKTATRLRFRIGNLQVTVTPHSIANAMIAGYRSHMHIIDHGVHIAPNGTVSIMR